jgi:hypothetical protein
VDISGIKTNRVEKPYLQKKFLNLGYLFAEKKGFPFAMWNITPSL